MAERIDPSDAPSASNPDLPDKLVIATRDVPPFAMRDEGGAWQGISIDLARVVAAELQAESGRELPLEFRDLALGEMLDAVERGEVDMAAAALTMNYEREKRMDFSHPIHQAGLAIAVGTEQRKPGWTGVIQAVFSPAFLRIVATLGAMMLLSAIAIYVFERKQSDGDFKGGWTRGIASGLWWAAVTLTTVGYGDKVPRTTAGRLMGAVWMFLGLFIVASFTAAVTSALTVTQLRSRISGPADLARVRVATVTNSTSADYLRSRHIGHQTFADVGQALQHLKDGKCDAVVYDDAILRYEVFQHQSGDAYVLPITFAEQNYAFALPEASPLRERVNQVLLREISSPEWEAVLAGYLGESLP
ncbi:transporter substrate-binding domain-containing protein [Roseiconus nitratireducens]|uniref:transporter substrate-binding domain-containing protein n=1 Tax=Roseiconus nitratireducens TaxID=2605748 RepID=UPI0013759643|nr:transporter substrate-binding domain-containing protein [Roseiconus nitratireducens]